MNYCAIGPLAMGETLKKHSHHMALAQYLYHEDYFEFYRDQLERGHFVVLDNGAYEGAQLDDRALHYWIQKLKPTAVVLPDEVGNFKMTALKSIMFADELNGKPYVPDMWKVIHAEDGELSDFVLSYLYDSRMFNGVCFSRLTERYMSEQLIGLNRRIDFIKLLKENNYWNKHCYHHALGMLNGNRIELNGLTALGVNSFDSSNPLWRSRGHSGDFDPFVELTDEELTFDYDSYLTAFHANINA